MLLLAIGCKEDYHDHEDEHSDVSTKETEGSHADVVHMDAVEMASFGVELAEANARRLNVSVSLPGEVVVDPNRLAHIVPRVAGVVREVMKRQGDRVRVGELMAILDSRELAEDKASFLSARERLAMAKLTFDREERLWKQEISSEREYLEAKQGLLEAEISRQEAEQKLHSLGLLDSDLEALKFGSHESFSQLDATAPFDGTIIEKHITRGELLDENDEAFVVADLSRVWVNLTVYQKDLPFVRVGQFVEVTLREGGLTSKGTVFYVSPTIDEATRTATARIELDNSDGTWRPGLFVSSRMAVDDFEVGVAIAKSALQTVEGRTAVFVRTGDVFEARGITLGREDATFVEVLSGVRTGEEYAVSGAFILKSQLEKGAISDGHNH
ncbi:MAG: efflux RND transporter periplasmic adaptor subunit [Candidatus Latescibacterota bacterium]|nr:efflux RND transporter periplasmic adaptor subunit [Candidatus Latescibacterota bacterium]